MYSTVSFVPEALDRIQPVITSLLSQGILKETTSPCNTPILPLPKPGRTDEWRFVQDLRAVNNCVVPITPIVPDTHTILSSIPSDSTHYTVIDLCSAFFSIPVHPDSQYLFAFTYKRKQYTWTRMPQGYTESPTIYAAAVNRDLADLHLLGNSTLIQYADDLLLASPSKDVCIKDTLLLLTHLANKGHRASLSKMQYCQERVQYLGHVLHNGTRQLSQGRITTLLSTTRPQTKKQMMSFLGMANFCRQWIFEYRAMEAVLRNATLNDKPVNIEWSEEINIAFESLKKALPQL